MSGRRLPALVVVAALLAILVALSGDGHGRRQVAFGTAANPALPSAAPAGALGSTWYCAAGTAERGGSANLSVTVVNVGDRQRSGTVTWIPTGGGRPMIAGISVAPNAVAHVAALDSLAAPIVSALVEMDGGQVAVEHVVSGPRGSSVAPCATQASPTWYLANGVTERDAGEVLALFNPFPDDAVVDVSLSTEQGRDDPPSLQGLPVPAGTTTFLNVHDAVRRRAVTAASIVARTGRLVVDRVESFDGSAGRNGISLALAAPAPAATWRFPDGLFQDGLSETWHVYNPGADEADVNLQLVPATGDAPDPLEITVPPHGQQTIDAAGSKLVATNVAHSMTIRSLNGVPVVVERAVDAHMPALRRGWSSSLGAPSTARRWVFPVGEATSATDEWIVIDNPGARKVTVSVLALAAGERLPIEGLQNLTVGPAGRLALRLGDHISRAPLPVVVEADGDVVAERDAYGVGRIGLSAVIGIPY